MKVFTVTLEIEMDESNKYYSPLDTQPWKHFLEVMDALTGIKFIGAVEKQNSSERV